MITGSLRNALFTGESMGWSWGGDGGEKGGRGEGDERLGDAHITSSFSVTPISITQSVTIKERKKTRRSYDRTPNIYV